MGYIELANVRFTLPGGRVLFDDLSFKVPAGKHVALVGANGVGKTTVLRLLSGDEGPQDGVVRVDGRLGYMRQFVGSFDAQATVHDLILELAEPRVRSAWIALQRAEEIVAGPHGGKAQMRYAETLAAWGEAGGYDAEVLWDTCTTAALGKSLSEVGGRRLSTLSGGEQKRVALELFFRSEFGVLLLDEPDNFLDIAGKTWLENSLNALRKTVLYVTHDRAMLANTAHALVTLEGRAGWTHSGPFSTYMAARQHRLEKIEEERRRYKEEHSRIVAQIAEFKRRAAMNDKFASRARAAESKLGRFERDSAPRESVTGQDIRMDLGGGRSGKIALRAIGLSLPGLVAPFAAEIWFGDRVGVVGANGTGKTHFLKLLAGEDVDHLGEWKLGARVEPSLFSQLHERPDLDADRSIVDALKREGLYLGQAISALKRYELQEVANIPFSLLSGGQQARLQILMMELRGSTMLLLDEPTDNLDIESAEALEEALSRYEGTVLVVTHDRWFMGTLDRFLVFNLDGSVSQSTEAPYSTERVTRAGS
nr:ABC-F family ATP-binding cassette domain-containing protein [Actinomycetota bacterium]